MTTNKFVWSCWLDADDNGSNLVCLDGKRSRASRAKFTDSNLTSNYCHFYNVCGLWNPQCGMWILTSLLSRNIGLFLLAGMAASSFSSDSSSSLSPSSLSSSPLSSSSSPHSSSSPLSSSSSSLCWSRPAGVASRELRLVPLSGELPWDGTRWGLQLCFPSDTSITFTIRTTSTTSTTARVSALLDGWLWQRGWFWFSGVLHLVAGVLHPVVGVLHQVVGVLNTVAGMLHPVVGVLHLAAGVLHPDAKELHFKRLEAEDHFFVIFEISYVSVFSHEAEGRVGVLIRALLDSDHTLGFQCHHHLRWRSFKGRHLPKNCFKHTLSALRCGCYCLNWFITSCRILNLVGWLILIPN